MKLTRSKLEKLVPGSRAYRKNGQLVWEAPPGGHRLSGKKQRGSGGQEEGQEPLAIVETAFWLKGSGESPWFIEENKDGIRFREENWRLSHVHFIQPGEECVTSFAGKGLIEHCTFRGRVGADKCLQLNVADNVEIRRCKFYWFITGIQAGLRKYARKSHVTEVTDCAFDDVETPISAVKGIVYLDSNRYHDMKTGNREVDGGRFKRLPLMA